MGNSGDWQIAKVGKSAERGKSLCVAKNKNLLEPRKVWEIADLGRNRKFGYYRGSENWGKSLSGRNDVGIVAAARNDVGDLEGSGDWEILEFGRFRRIRESGRIGRIRKIIICGKKNNTLLKTPKDSGYAEIGYFGRLRRLRDTGETGDMGDTGV